MENQEPHLPLPSTTIAKQLEASLPPQTQDIFGVIWHYFTTTCVSLATSSLIYGQLKTATRDLHKDTQEMHSASNKISSHPTALNGRGEKCTFKKKNLVIFFGEQINAVKCGKSPQSSKWACWTVSIQHDWLYSKILQRSAPSEFE